MISADTNNNKASRSDSASALPLNAEVIKRYLIEMLLEDGSEPTKIAFELVPFPGSQFMTSLSKEVDTGTHSCPSKYNYKSLGFCHQIIYNNYS